MSHSYLNMGLLTSCFVGRMRTAKSSVQRLCLCLLGVLALYLNRQAGNIGINVNGATLNASGLLDIKYDIERVRFCGFLEQQVEQAAKDAGYDLSGVDKRESGKGHLGLRFAEFTIPMVKSMQEQQAMVVELRAQVVALQEDLERLR